MNIIEKWVEACARAAHEANKSYCEAIGDDSQPSWEDAPEWQRLSAISGVAAILNDPDLTPEQSHELWCQTKEATGWVHGIVKDPEAKTHPCLVPYASLPVSQQAKDHIFGAVVRAMWAAFNKEGS